MLSQLKIKTLIWITKGLKGNPKQTCLSGCRDLNKLSVYEINLI